MKKALFFLLLFSTPAYIFSQAEVNISDLIDDAEALFEDDTTPTPERQPQVVSGYLESTLAILEAGTNREWALQNANKLKIRLDSRTELYKVHAEINLLYYSGLIDFNLLDYVPGDTRTPLMAFYTNFGQALQPSVEVAQAYAALNLGNFQFQLGRQPITMGTGYVWNPVDGINTKNTLDPSYELGSHDALVMSMSLPLNGEFRLGGIVAEQLSNISIFFTTKFHSGFDWELSLATLERTETDLSTFVTTNYRQQIAGLSASGQIWDIGLHAELAYHLDGRVSNHLKTLVGADYTFKFQNQVMLEYYWDQSADTSAATYSLSDWLWYLSGSSKALGRHNFFFSTTQSFLELHQLNLSILYNATDGSAYLLPSYTFDIEVFQIMLRGGINLGDTGTEFGDFPASAELRLTAYF